MTTNCTQYQKMVECLSERPDIARGFAKGAKEDVQAFWESVAEQLNSLGPPSKDVSSWKKVWLDYKSYIKRKLTANKSEARATGGGPNRMQSFNDVEEKVIELTGMHTTTSGISGTVPCGLESARQSITEPELDVSMTSLHEGSNVQRCANTPNTPRRAENKMAALVQDQLNLQKDYYKKNVAILEEHVHSSKQIEENVRRLYQVAESNYDVSRETLREMQRHNSAMENLKKKELELQERLVIMQEKNLKK